MGVQTEGLRICIVDRGCSAMEAEEAMSPVGERVRSPGLNYPTVGLASDLGDGYGLPGAAVAMSLVDDAEVDADEDAAARATWMAEPVVQELAALGPDEWAWCRAEFAFTVAAEVADVSFETSDGWQVQLADVPADVMALVREQREVSAGMAGGPWWRLIVDVSADGEFVVGYDYGEDPFPADQLQAAQNYRDDIVAYPRPSLPVWLAAYLAGPTAQGRNARTAASEAWVDGVAGRVATRVDDVAPVRDVWARWAVLAALHIGVGSAEGPRIAPGMAWYESGARSGATLVLLPGNRAVLSGGWWESPLLAAAYLDDEPLPDLYAGAPGWVNDAVLNIRCQQGMLSFCYWWVDGRWECGATNTVGELDVATPAVWSVEATVTAMTHIGGLASETASRDLLAAATDGAVTVAHVDAALAAVPGADVDLALNPLAAAGLIR